VFVHKVDYFVIPAPIFIGINFSRNPSGPEALWAGGQNRLKSLDSRFHGNDSKAIYKQTLIRSRWVVSVLGRGGEVFEAGLKALEGFWGVLLGVWWSVIVHIKGLVFRNDFF